MASVVLYLEYDDSREPREEEWRFPYLPQVGDPVFLDDGDSQVPFIVQEIQFVIALPGSSLDDDRVTIYAVLAELASEDDS